MKAKPKSFVITLNKTGSGYTFQTALLLPEAKTNDKNNKPPFPKNTSWRPSMRIVKQLAPYPKARQYEEDPLLSVSKDPVSQNEIPQSQPAEDEDLVAEFQKETELPETPAKWFSLQQTHQIQRDKLPEFFNTRTYKTEELYVKLRNLIVNLYRQNPKEYLTKVACRRVMRGDVNTIMRIHNFLEGEGVINFGLSVEGVFSFKPSFVNKIHEMQHLPQSTITEVKQWDENPVDLSPELDNLTYSVVNKPFSRTYRVYCSQCSLICGMAWYYSRGDQSFNLCFDCYSPLDPQRKQQFTETNITDKISTQTNGSQRGRRSNWSIEENIKLLEMMSQPEKDWKYIMESFDNKKPMEDIVLQFMQFPITNFQPNMEQTNKKQKTKVAYAPEQYIAILESFLTQSSYVKKPRAERQISDDMDIFPPSDEELQKCEAIQEQLVKEQPNDPQQMDDACKMVSLMLKKYRAKIHNLKLVEQTIERNKDTVLNSLECRRQKQPRPLTNSRQQPFGCHNNLEDLEDQPLFPASNEDQQEEPMMPPREDDYSDLLNLGSESHNDGES